MFRKRKPEPQARQAAKAAVKLTAAEKREISRILETARGDGKVHSAQDTLPFRQMYPDGLCKLDDHTWSKCIEFEDVNYQLAKPDDQTAIFEALCDMYNAHDASIGMQLSLVSRRMNREDFVKRIEIAAQGDHFDHIRELYTQMLRKQLERGNNGLIKTDTHPRGTGQPNRTGTIFPDCHGRPQPFQGHGRSGKGAWRQGVAGNAPRHPAPGRRTVCL